MSKMPLTLQGGLWLLFLFGLFACGTSQSLRRLPEPKFLLEHYAAEDNPDTSTLSGSVRFSLRKEEKNTRKPEEWLKAKDLQIPAKVFHDGATTKALVRTELPSPLPDAHRTFKQGKKVWYLAQVLVQGEDWLYFYGNAPNEFYVITQPSLLRIYNTRNKKFTHTLDFINFGSPPEYIFREKDFVFEKLLWARVENNRLYVQNAHWTYAESSKGCNAYLSALDLNKKGKLLWRSQPLVANAANFLDFDRFLVSAYGFTREPGHLYALDKQSGKVLGSLQLFPKSSDAQKHISFMATKGRIIHLKLGDGTEYEIEVHY